ncbi:MAG: hypothetical protein QW514_08040 [Thermoprotei archaeon]
MVNHVEALSLETRELTMLFAERLDRLRNHAGAPSVAVKPARPKFSLRDGYAVGVDGSMDYDEHLELLLFYVAAAAYTCPYRVGSGIGVEFDLKAARRDDSLDLSTVVPLWSDDLDSVLQADLGGHTEQDEVARVQRVPFSLMTMAELSLGLSSLEREDVGILFLDRPLSATYHTLQRDLRVLLSSSKSVLVGAQTPWGELSWLDLALASVLGPPGMFVPNRRPYTVYHAISVLLEESKSGGATEGFSPAVFGERLGLNDRQLNRLLRALSRFDEKYGGTLFSEFSPVRITVTPSVPHYWSRVLFVTQSVIGRIFGGSGHPLYYGGNSWLSVLELSAINTFLLLELVSRALRRGVLVLGITKDTSATDYVRAALPYLYANGVVRFEPHNVGFKNDRSFLTILSASNYNSVSTPWRTHSYDSCFASLIHVNSGRMRAARKTLLRERLFVGAYFQLRSFNGDPSMRSPVFRYDRPYDPSRDAALTRSLEAEDFKGSVTLTPFVELGDHSTIDDLVLWVLAAADNPEVLEAYGHNQLLYLADKAVKAKVKLMRNTLRGIAYHELSEFERRERIFMVSKRFRELRAEIEAERNRSLKDEFKGGRGSNSV